VPGSRWWPAGPGLFFAAALLVATPATARDATWCWAPSPGPVEWYVVSLVVYPCDALAWRQTIGGTRTTCFTITDASAWEPYCVEVFPIDADANQGPMSPMSEPEGELPPPPPEPIPEPGRLPMLLVGIAALALLAWRRRPV